ncbi:cobalamin biosynthesis protein [Rubrimonas sp.]|uniref:cobalamin biosynthesis protein n=1 Tax=Rubrimonas sp. TaxID=2036015 RepID=UPI002FDDCA49
MIVAGFGFRRSATAESLADALGRAGGPARVRAVASAADKAASSPFLRFADALGLPVVAVSEKDLGRQSTVTLSAASLSARGVGSVAEAAALAGAGPGARLLSARVISADGLATCALAERADP